ncbi:MAG: hypothetical protein ACI976_001970 [Aureispira sp.]|jgi:hypothetical protein
MDSDEIEDEITRMNTMIHDFEDIEKDGFKNIVKYFDRIHDKLFSFNNIMIGGYFFLASFEKSISFSSIIFPLINMLILIFIDYRMMERSRVESKIMSIPQKEHKAHNKSIDKTNLYSLFTIISTLVVIGVFLSNMYSLPNKNTVNLQPSQNTILDTPQTSILIQTDSLIKEDKGKIDSTKISISPSLNDSLSFNQTIDSLSIVKPINSK